MHHLEAMIIMPIVVMCSNCNTRLSAPDTAAGKKVRCPKADCGTIIAVPPPPPPKPPALAVVEHPGFEVVEEDPHARVAPLKAVLAEEDDEPGPKKKDQPSRQYDPEEYSPDGGFSVIGIPILLVALCLAAIFMGGLASIIGSFFYLIFIFPVGISLGVAAVGYFIVHLTKMRNMLVAGILGLISGVVAMVSMHFFDYQWFLLAREVDTEEIREIEKIPAHRRTPEQAAAIQSLKETKDVNSFGSFMHFQATQGVSIGKVGREGTNIGFTGTWIYWSLELLCVAVCTTGGLVLGSMRPFCTDCETWKKARKLGTLQIDDGEIVEVMKDGKVDDLHIHDPAETGGNVILTAYVCPNCRSEAPIVIKVEEVKVKDAKKGETETKERAKLVFPGEALAAFKALFGKKSRPAKKRRREDDED
jgi:hypothetical protein